MLALMLAPLVAAPVAVQVERESHGAIIVRVETEVNAPLRAIEAVILDARDYASWFPSTQSVRILDSNCHTIVFEGHFKLPWPVRDAHETVRLERRAFPGGVAISWRQQRGDFRRNDGLWTLISRKPGMTVVTYEATWQPRRWVPRWMLRIAAQRQAPRMMRALEGQAQAREPSESYRCVGRAVGFAPIARR
jgi:ribosome-associated toxin RatA of RatAB toxin-antitoxin module